MVLELKALDARLAAALLEDPRVVNAVVFGEDEWGEDEADEMFGGVDPRVVLEGVTATADLDKSWHGVHFLLTGATGDADSMLGRAVLGGREVGEDHGYGPARLLLPDNVASIAHALATVDTARLRARFDPAVWEAAGIYPIEIWGEADILDEYLMPNLELLRSFYADASAAGRAVLAVLT